MTDFEKRRKVNRLIAELVINGEELSHAQLAKMLDIFNEKESYEVGKVQDKSDN